MRAGTSPEDKMAEMLRGQMGGGSGRSRFPPPRARGWKNNLKYTLPEHTRDMQQVLDSIFEQSRESGIPLEWYPDHPEFRRTEEDI